MYKDHQLYPVPIMELEPDPNQPRKTFNEETLKELAQSIRSKGVLQPVLFRMEGERKILIAGERRLRAAKMAGLSTIPAIFLERENAAEISLIENLARENLTPLEEAEALAHMQKEFHHTLDSLSKVLGKSKSTVSEILKLNRLAEKIKEQCREENRWSRRVLLEIAKEKDEENQLKLFKKARRSDLTGDAIRALT